MNNINEKAEQLAERNGEITSLKQRKKFNLAS